ncbi:MAG: prolipoprotein diacylglyceryl transferase [Hyphomicrobiales bacterium]
MRSIALTFPEIDPVAIQLGPLAIKWYGLAYIAGIAFAWWYMRRLVVQERLWGPPRGGTQPMTPAMVDDVIFWGAVGMIAGGRLGYVLFYKPLDFFTNPLEVFAIWQGGMSFHGGFIGVLLAVYLFCRRYNADIMQVFDLAGASVPIGLGLGRVANFINGELWGRVTDASIGMVFPGAGGLPRHPSQLYEAALEGLVLFLLMRFLTHSLFKLKKPGFVTGAAMAGYGAFRIIAEFFREPDAHIGFLAGPLTMGMVLSLPMVAGGIWLMVWAERRA